MSGRTPAVLSPKILEAELCDSGGGCLDRVSTDWRIDVLPTWGQQGITSPKTRRAMAKEKKSKKSKDKKVKRASESSSAVEAAKELIVSTSSANSEEGLTEIKKQVKKKLRKTLGRKPTKEEVEARVQKRLKKAAKAGSADGKESKTTEAPAAPTSAGVVELPKKMKSHKKEKKSAESDRKAKRKRTNGGDEDEEGVSTRLDWTEAQVQGGTQRKDKFLRLMGGKKSAGARCVGWFDGTL